MFESLLTTLIRNVGFKAQRVDIAALPSGRVSASAAFFNGKCYIVGGAINGATSGSLISYNPGNNTYDNTLAPLPLAVYFTGLVAHSTGLYAIGGKPHGGSTQPYKAIYRYTPANNTWTELAPLTNGQWTHSTFIHKDKIYVWGGSNASSGAAASFATTIYVYDIPTNTWASLEPTGSVPPKRNQAQGCVVGDKIYIFGGWSGSAVLADAWEFDILTSKWTQLANIPVPAYCGVSYTVEGRVFHGTGLLNGASTLLTNKMFEYIIAENKHVEVTGLIAGTSNAAACASENRAFIFGGTATGGVTPAIATSFMYK